MRDNIPDALITAFERQYDSSWNDPQLRNERLAMRYGWAAAMEAKPCLHQIQEPAPATAMDALREAEAALEVAMARILKADPSHSICVTSEAKALVAVRAALAAPAPMLVAQPQLHAALFAARGALQHMKEGGKPTQSLLNEAIAAIDSVAVTQAAPAAVAVPDEREALQDGEWYWIEKEGWHGNPPTIAPALYKAECDAWYSFAFAGIPTRQLKVLEPCLLQARAALAATPAAAPVVLPEPVSDEQIKAVFLANGFTIKEGLTDLKPYVYQAARALLATGGQAQAVQPITGPCGQCKSSIQPCDCAISTILKERGLVAVDATHYSKVSAQAKAAAPQAQADARDAVEFWGVMAPCGEGVIFNNEADARWTLTGHGSGSDGFGVPTIGEAFRECYEDEELELVRVHIAAIAAAKPHEEPAA